MRYHLTIEIEVLNEKFLLDSKGNFRVIFIFNDIIPMNPGGLHQSGLMHHSWKTVSTMIWSQKILVAYRKKKKKSKINTVWFSVCVQLKWHNQTFHKSEIYNHNTYMSSIPLFFCISKCVVWDKFKFFLSKKQKETRNFA